MPTRYKSVQEALKGLRAHMQITQQELAVRLGKAVVTVSRWETSRPPRGAELAGLLDLATQQKDQDVVEALTRAVANELHEKADGIPETLEEASVIEVLLVLMRNRELAHEHYAAAVTAVLDGFTALTKTGEKLVGIPEDRIPVMKSEVAALRKDLSVAARAAGH